MAALLRRAERDRRDGAALLDDGSARLLFGLAAHRLIQAVLVSEHGMAALRPAQVSQARQAATVPAANPLRAGLLGLQGLAEASAAAPAMPGSDGRFADLAAVAPAEAAALRRMIEQAMAGYAVTLDGEAPAGREVPLRPPPPPEPEPKPVVKADGGTARMPAAPRPAEPRAFQAPGAGGAMIAPAASGPVGAAPFWSLMDRWGVDDLQALRLIGHAGGLTKKGTRPRFRLAGAEASRFRLLQQIDAALGSAGLDPGAWLRAPSARAEPLGGQAPLEHIVEAGEAGARAVHRLLLQAVLRRSMG